MRYQSSIERTILMAVGTV